jgi:spore maturation protein CgeB
METEALRLFWDVDAPATLERVFADHSDPFRDDIPVFDAVCTYGGGQKVVDAYRSLGARVCVPVYNAVDSATHYRVEADPSLACCLAFQGNRLPDRESRVDEFFFKPARLVGDEIFVLGGSGWSDKAKTENVKYIGHVGTEQHNAFNSSARLVLNINRDSMATYGFSPPTRVFEAAATAACLITDRWQGIELFLDPGREILVADDGAEVARLMRRLETETARSIGEAARKRILSEHTYRHRAVQVDELLQQLAREDRSARRVFA